MRPFQPLLLLGSAGWTAAFETLKPEFIADTNVSYVASYVSNPPRVAVARKQATLALSASSPASSTVDIAVETMTGGMAYLQSSSEDNTAFYIDLTIDAKDYPVLLDTGSPYLWLYSDTCTSQSCINNKDNLFSDKSKGLLYMNNTFDLSYTQKTVASGEIVKEDMMIIANFKTPDFKFGLADQVPDIFENYPFVGVLGLPADNSSVTGLENIVSYLYDTGDINHSKFTILMGSYPESDTENSGLLFLGDTKENLKSGEMYTSSLIKSASSHWEFQIDSVYINDAEVSFQAMEINGLSTNQSRIGLLDSGTTSIVLPKSDAMVIHSYFQNSITDGENYAIYCNATNAISFEISGKNWTITPQEYLGPAYDTTGSLAGYCVSNIQGMESTNDNSWILGILFMMDKYVEFDYENQWIGIAERNSNIKFVQPPSGDSVVGGTPSDTPTTMITSTTSSESPKTASASATSLTRVSSTNGSSSIENYSLNWFFMIPLILSYLG